MPPRRARPAICALLLLLATACDAGRRERPRLVLLVSVDTLRADRLGAYGSGLGLTPRLDELASRSEVFETAYAPASFTVPSLCSVLTGRHPQQLGIRVNESFLVPGVPTLAEALRDAGYRTGAVVSNFVLRRGTGLDRGFERYDDRVLPVEGGRGLPERIAPRTTDDALELLDELRADGAPVLLWVHYQDPHGPYTPPEEHVAGCVEVERSRPDGGRHLPFGKDFRGLGGIPNYQRLGDQDEVAFYRGSYDAEVRFTDEHIGRLLDGIASRGLLEGALVVFLADHGESLGEDDYWFAHGEYLSDPLVRVPLFIAAPGRAPGRRPEVVGLIDLLPTILPLAGVPPLAGVSGRDAFTIPSGGSVLYLSTMGGSTVPRLALVEGRYKYLIEAARPGQEVRQQLFKLGDETRDLAGEEPGRTADMRAKVDLLRNRMRSEGEAALRQLSPEDREKLRKLGYAGDESPR